MPFAFHLKLHEEHVQVVSVLIRAQPNPKGGGLSWRRCWTVAWHRNLEILRVMINARDDQIRSWDFPS